ncbi:Pyridoxamine 5'-phosphate oxidase [Nocardia amikacinitolerans]|uniref:Pyridoxamine 5'-phosphate oxidase n=1 Tax=Nocardia amikacinitolerans TaxID=756689 RepID=A0A285L2A6_9NOCA|nr:pyridoxamine 5'-phosphate oxidase family protein [Nocardia amikacinitolerans]MCP2278060.1 Pyridoxamine 5'-phosphate oxidase [Nocardia amikacinitolerans]MCP2296637.1 Pyridoxamine 5'-phosphate oxidase [Nocardia amikacinitolerans]SNY79058.1 Pyridoxamine 5'-phosphate oxidase [Nocardia amikacinitolerans]
MSGSRTDCDVVELAREEALTLLARAPFGRVVYTRDALPAIRPVNHLLDDGLLIVRTRLASQFSATVRSRSEVVVAYEADDIDIDRRTGWSVVVTGIARPVTDPARTARYQRILRPWIGAPMDGVIEIEPTLVSGIRLVDNRTDSATADG